MPLAVRCLSITPGLASAQFHQQAVQGLPFVGHGYRVMQSEHRSQGECEGGQGMLRAHPLQIEERSIWSKGGRLDKTKFWIHCSDGNPTSPPQNVTPVEQKFKVLKGSVPHFQLGHDFLLKANECLKKKRTEPTQIRKSNEEDILFGYI
jgi:hypothetical protein